MAVIIDENFEEYTLGIETPFGPWTGHGVIVQEPGASKGSVQACLCGDMTIPYPAIGGLSIFGVSFAYKFGGSGSGLPLVTLSNGPNPPGGFPTRDLFFLSVDLDNSLTAFTEEGIPNDAMSSLPCNTLINKGFSLYSGEWNFIVLNMGFLINGDGSTDPSIYCSGTLSINDVEMFNWVKFYTGGSIRVGDVGEVFTHSPSITGMTLQPPAGAFLGGWIDNVGVADGSIGYLHPAMPPGPNVKITNYAIEYQYNDLLRPRVRETAAAIEVQTLPNSRNVRETAAAIEVKGNGIFPSRSGKQWLVKES
jgi:hypothetical protein